MQKKLFIITLGILILYSSCKNKTISDNSGFVWNSTLTIEQNIASSAISFQSNKEFPFLDKIAKRSQVIIFGERGHYDRVTSETKINMVNYLRDKNFNSIALECAPFLTSYIFSHPDYSEITGKWKIKDFWTLSWVMQGRCEPLFEMINNREIKIWGIDSYLGKYDVTSARAILSKHADSKLPEIEWDKFAYLYNNKFVVFRDSQYISLSISEQYELMRTIDVISNYTQYLMLKKKNDTMDLKVLMQWIRNINTAFSFVEHYHPSDENKVKLIFRNRDSQMAENILWITKNSPKEKFTVWCANFHGAKDISQTRYPTDSLLYFTFQSMGEGVYNELGNKVYSLAFTSLDEVVEERGTLEQEIVNVTNDSSFAFIDFKALRFANEYCDKEFDCAVIMKKRGKWLYVFDGLYYIRDQKDE